MLNILSNYSKIVEAYENISEFEVWVGHQPIKIKIVKNIKDKFFFSTSHYYHGSEQAGPYVSSINGFDTKEEALSHAARQILSFYKEDDEDAVWKENDLY